MPDSSVPVEPAKAIGTRHHDPQKGFVAWLLDRANREQDIPADGPLSEDEEVLKMARAVAACVADGCLDPTGVTSSHGIAAHAAEHTTDGVLPEWLDRAFARAVSMHAWTPIDLTALLDGDRPRANWGPWRLYSEPGFPPMLAHARRGYEIPLDECGTPERVLDRLAQINGKNWADDATLAGLLRAFDDILHLQQHLCGFGARGELRKEHITALAREHPYSAMCGECGRWQTKAQFEKTGGCCSRRAVDHHNRWPGDSR